MLTTVFFAFTCLTQAAISLVNRILCLQHSPYPSAISTEQTQFINKQPPKPCNIPTPSNHYTRTNIRPW